MPRLKGFSDEDYTLAQEIMAHTGFPIAPSKACDAAEEWALAKMRKRAKKLWDAGYHEHAKSLYNTCALLQDGEL